METRQPKSILQKQNFPENKITPDILPFENIALAFSGGGFRAASFSLGVLAYLDSVRFTDHTSNGEINSLLKKVRYISSASGGSFTNALYALHSCSRDADNFKLFYHALCGHLNGDILLQKALTILTTDKDWESRPQKTPNLINAFAIAYDENLFKGATVADLFPASNRRTHLQEVCFNATEFYRGLLFRQQVKMQSDIESGDYVWGNYAIRLTGDSIGRLKLGDVLAASSCFPAGFEPIVFPQDFTYNAKGDSVSTSALAADLLIEPQTGDEKEAEAIAAKTVGLMDGGITDNQGLESMMQADEARRNGKSQFASFDLLLVNDVGSHYMDPYVVPPINPDKIWRKLSIRGIFLTFIILAILSLVLIYFGIDFHSIGLAIAGSILFAVSALVTVLLSAAGKIFSSTTSTTSSFRLSNNFGKSIVSLLGKYFKRTGLNILKQLLKTRASSVLTLNNEVFLKRIRFLLYETFYGSPLWKNRGKANHVYDLSITNNLYRKKDDQLYGYAPSAAMQVVAENAYKMGTTLWFDKTCVEELHTLESLIATGQFTTCYNLLIYIQKLTTDKIFDGFDESFKTRIAEIRSSLLSDYEHFQQDPFFMVNSLSAGVPGFQPLTVADIKI